MSLHWLSQWSDIMITVNKSNKEALGEFWKMEMSFIVKIFFFTTARTETTRHRILGVGVTHIGFMKAVHSQYFTQTYQVDFSR